MVALNTYISTILVDYQSIDILSDTFIKWVFPPISVCKEDKL